jgi:hypothetical protein
MTDSTQLTTIYRAFQADVCVREWGFYQSHSSANS